jgi:lipase chaperone LimK
MNQLHERVMAKQLTTDYETYREIMDELVRPIESSGLDIDTLKRLYESKLVYLENLRVKCFLEINNGKASHFSMEDYQLILKAARDTEVHVKDLIMIAIMTNLERRKIS